MSDVIRNPHLHERLAFLAADYVWKVKLRLVFADVRTDECKRRYLLIERRRKLARHLLRKIQAARHLKRASNVIDFERILADEFRRLGKQAGPL